MNISLLIIILLIGGIASYFLTKVNEQLGAYSTIAFSLYGFIMLLINIDSIYTETLVPYMEFRVSELATYFSLVMLFIYSMVSFFNPFFIKKYSHKAAYNAFYLLSLAGTVGLFYASNFIVMFIFWELVVFTSMFIIPLGKSRNASVVYYAVSAIGSFAMLYGMFLMFVKLGTFNIYEAFALLPGNQNLAVLIYVLFGVAAFAKLGAYPLHIWLPLAHGSAPDTFSPVLSGGLVKMGAFVGMLTLVVLDQSAFSHLPTMFGIPILNYVLMILGGISIVVGTLMAISQDDAKKLLAYSSVSNSGYILIGMAMADSIGVGGSLFHIFAHALGSGAAFMAIGAVSYRTGTTKMSELGGMIHPMPVTYMVYLMAIISLAGIPPMGGFISKWLIFQTLIDKGLVFVAAAAFFGSIGSFLYVFRPLAALFLGQKLPKHKDVKEVNILMLLPMGIMSMVTFIIGVWPVIVLDYINKVLVSLNIAPIILEGFTIQGFNGTLHPALIAGIFGFGVVLAAIMFFLLPKSRKVGLMDTYTAGEFIYTPELLHYSADFYAPIERLYAKYPKLIDFYKSVVGKIKELGEIGKYLFMRMKPALSVLWLIVILILVMWGELV
jgi:NADH-quinone oxidoreductase subunit M